MQALEEMKVISAREECMEARISPFLKEDIELAIDTRLRAGKILLDK